jgi:natural product precursor
MKKSLNNLRKDLNVLSNDEMQNLKGGGVMGTNYNTFCEWYAGLTNQTMDEMMATPMGQVMYQIDVALGLM